MWTDDNDNAKKLPDVYRKDAEGNNWKLLTLDKKFVQSFNKDLQDVYNSLDFFSASGKTLDLFGDIVDQKRGAFDDTRYKYLIQAKIARYFVKGDYKDIMRHLVIMFNCSQGDIELEDFDIADDDAPCVVRLTKMPFLTLIAAGFTSKQAVALIESVLPVCVTLKADNFEGTFEFGEYFNDEQGERMEYDELKGFGNVEQTIGGLLGLMLGDDEESPLPI